MLHCFHFQLDSARNDEVSTDRKQDYHRGLENNDPDEAVKSEQNEKLLFLQVRDAGEICKEEAMPLAQNQTVLGVKRLTQSTGQRQIKPKGKNY